MQDVLQQMTGQRTVPNVFINGTEWLRFRSYSCVGKHIGGCDKTHELKESGELAKILQ